MALIGKSIQDFKQRYNITKHFSSEALSVLMNFDWPGNVRQLQNLIERLAIFSTENLVSRARVEFELARETEKDNLNNYDFKYLADQPLKIVLEELEKKMILNALEKSSNNEEAARLLGIHRTTLVRKIQKHGIYFNSK